MRFSQLFPRVGRFVSRYWAPWIGFWVALLLVGRWQAPPWEEVAQDQEFAFLPADVPSRLGEAMFQKAFPDDRLSSTIVLVIRDPAGNIQRTRGYIGDVLEPRLRQIAQAHGGIADQEAVAEAPLFGDETPVPPKNGAEPLVVRIRTPNAPGAGTLLVSTDGQVQLVVVEMATEFLAHRNWPLIADVEKMVEELPKNGQLPPGVEVVVTGSAVIGRDHTQAQLESARATERLTSSW